MFFLTVSCIVCIFVGFLCGAASIGGILLIPAIQYGTGMSLSMAAGTALCSFVFTTLFGTWLHWREGNLDWSLVLPQSIGAIIFGCLGAFTKYIVGDVTLNVLLASLIIFSGVAALRPPRAMRGMMSGRKRWYGLMLVGAFVSFMAGLTGMGGGVLSVPMTIIMGFSPLAAVAAAQPFQVIACVSGTVGNFFIDQIDWYVAIVTAILQNIGVWLGILYARRMDTTRLKKAIAFLCVFTGIFMMMR